MSSDTFVPLAIAAGTVSVSCVIGNEAKILAGFIGMDQPIRHFIEPITIWRFQDEWDRPRVRLVCSRRVYVGQVGALERRGDSILAIVIVEIGHA